jgi:flagellar biosynthesis/type III secretory pathway chaperone
MDSLTHRNELMPAKFEDMSAREIAAVLRSSGVKVPRLLSAAKLRQVYRMELRRPPTMKEEINPARTGETGVTGQSHGQDPVPARLSAWKMDACFKCPICGLCLTMAEQFHLLKKAGYSLKGMSPYEIHEILVSSLESESRLSRLVDVLLHRKYASRAKHLFAAGDREFPALWQAFYGEDDEGALWAAAVRPGLPDARKREIFGQVHMAMHGHTHQRHGLNLKLDRQEGELAGLREQYHEAARARRMMQKENQSLALMNDTLRNEVLSVQKEKSVLAHELDELGKARPGAGIEEENRNLRAERDALSERNSRTEQRLAALMGENSRLKADLERHREANRLLSHEAREIIGKMRAAGRCDESCPTL